MEVLLSRHDRKKWQVLVPTERGYKRIAFGQMGAEDFTTPKDEDRKRLYLARHKPRENWEDPYTAGFGLDGCYGINRHCGNLSAH